MCGLLVYMLGVPAGSARSVFQVHAALLSSCMRRAVRALSTALLLRLGRIPCCCCCLILCCRLSVLALLFIPALGWVAFNILQPAFSQLNRMSELKDEAKVRAGSSCDQIRTED